MLHWGKRCIITQGVKHPQEVCALNKLVQQPDVLRRAQTKGRDDNVGMLLSAANDTTPNRAKERNCQMICPLCLRLSPCFKSHSMPWYDDRSLNNIDDTHDNANPSTKEHTHRSVVMPCSTSLAWSMLLTALWSQGEDNANSARPSKHWDTECDLAPAEKQARRADVRCSGWLTNHFALLPFGSLSCSAGG